MKSVYRFMHAISRRNMLLLTAALAVLPQSLAARTADDKIELPKLKEMITGLGFEVKDITESKFQFTIVKGDLNIPVAGEITPSKNYIWFTILLVQNVEENDANRAKAYKLLKQNGKVQPTQFYLTDKNNLMVALCAENRALTPAWLRSCIDRVTDAVVNTKDVWQ